MHKRNQPKQTTTNSFKEKHELIWFGKQACNILGDTKQAHPHHLMHTTLKEKMSTIASTYKNLKSLLNEQAQTMKLNRQKQWVQLIYICIHIFTYTHVRTHAHTHTYNVSEIPQFSCSDGTDLGQMAWATLHHCFSKYQHQHNNTEYIDIPKLNFMEYINKDIAYTYTIKLLNWKNQQHQSIKRK